MLIREMAPAAQCNFKIREELILHYLGTVERIAREYVTDIISFDDLVSVATIAMIDTIDGFGNRGYELSSYISSAVHHSIKAYIRDESRAYYDNAFPIEDAYWIQSFEINDLVDQISLKEAVRLDLPNIIPSDLDIFEHTKGYLSNIANSTLRARERRVLELRYGFDSNGSPTDKCFTLEETATVLGLSRERIRQIEWRGLMRLRHPWRLSRLRELYTLVPNCENFGRVIYKYDYIRIKPALDGVRKIDSEKYICVRCPIHHRNEWWNIDMTYVDIIIHRYEHLYMNKSKDEKS